MHRYAVGEWDSLWSSDPYMKHRFVLDLESRTVIAGEGRIRRRWWSMRLEDVAYMQQILNETFDSIWDEPEEFGFVRQAEIPAGRLKLGRGRRCQRWRTSKICWTILTLRYSAMTWAVLSFHPAS